MKKRTGKYIDSSNRVRVGRMPKDPVKAEARRLILAARAQLKQELAKRRYGSQGAAGPVKHIDPKDYEPPG